MQQTTRATTTRDVRKGHRPPVIESGRPSVRTAHIKRVAASSKPPVKSRPQPVVADLICFDEIESSPAASTSPSPLPAAGQSKTNASIIDPFSSLATNSSTDKDSVDFGTSPLPPNSFDGFDFPSATAGNNLSQSAPLSAPTLSDTSSSVPHPPMMSLTAASTITTVPMTGKGNRNNDPFALLTVEAIEKLKVSPIDFHCLCDVYVQWVGLV